MYIHHLFLLVVDHVDNTGGQRRGERNKAKDDGEASDGNEQEPGKIIASHGRREQVVPLGLVWLWRLEEEETKETRQTLNVNPTVKVGTIQQSNSKLCHQIQVSQPNMSTTKQQCDHVLVVIQSPNTNQHT